jgi:hypothetical protein
MTKTKNRVQRMTKNDKNQKQGAKYDSRLTQDAKGLKKC